MVSLAYQSASLPGLLMKSHTFSNSVSNCLTKKVSRHQYEALHNDSSQLYDKDNYLLISFWSLIHISSYMFDLLPQYSSHLSCATSSQLISNFCLSKGICLGFSSSLSPTFSVASPSFSFTFSHLLYQSFCPDCFSLFHSELHIQHIYDFFLLSIIWEFLWYIFFPLKT